MQLRACHEIGFHENPFERVVIEDSHSNIQPNPILFPTPLQPWLRRAFLQRDSRAGFAASISTCRHAIFNASPPPGGGQKMLLKSLLRCAKVDDRLLTI
jgi:hypothetical protein